MKTLFPAALWMVFCGVSATLLTTHSVAQVVSTAPTKTLPGMSDQDLKARLEIAGDNANELRNALAECKESPAESLCLRFLIENMPDSDLRSLKSEFLVKNIRLALKARADNSWSRKVPMEVFLNDVLPYASINEKREDWRTDFYNQFKDLVKHCRTTGEAAQELNKNVFQVLKVRYSTKRKKADQSPSESMETGLASCTGLSVILTDACRAVGVPARMAGTPLWVNRRGNHTWVEVWDEGEWKFTGACEYNSAGLNRGWFAGIASKADPDQMIHRIYATSFKKTDLHFPMVWKRQSREVPAVDVTWRYTGKPKPKAEGEYTVAFQTLSTTGKRIRVPIKVRGKNGKILAQGNTRDESNDANDYFEANLKPGSYEIEVESGGVITKSQVVVIAKENQVQKMVVKEATKK